MITEVMASGKVPLSFTEIRERLSRIDKYNYSKVGLFSSNSAP
jgi:hypothetical protein